MYVVKPVYQFQGLDLTTSDKARPEEKASEWLNGELDLSGKQRKRNGSQIKASLDNGGFGLISFRRVNPITREEENELLAIGENLMRYTECSIEIGYTGAGAEATAQVVLEAGVFRFKVTVDGSSVADVSLGTGIDSTPLTIASLATTIGGVADLTATTAGDTSVPAAFLDVTDSHDLIAGPITLKAASFTTINYRYDVGSGDLPFTDGTYNYQGVDEFVNPSYEILNDCLYIASGYLYKYDGQSVHYAGISAANLILNPSAVASASAVGAGTYQIKVRAVHVDNVGNRIIGDWSETKSLTLSAGQAISIQNTGWLSGADQSTVKTAQVNGAQLSASTVTVDSGHTLTQGDRVYFYDAASTSYKEAIISATTATTLTLVGKFDGSTAWDFNDNSIISTHRIEVCRTQAGGTDVFYLVDEIPADRNGATTHTSTTANGAELAEIVEPAYPPTFPPQCKFVTRWQNSLVVGGQPYSGTMITEAIDAERVGSSIQWNDLEFIEGFPIVHGLNFDTTLGDKISGLKEINDSLIVGKDQSIHRVTGNLGLLQLSAEVVTMDDGVASHHSMQDIGGILFFLSNNGVRAIQSAGLPRAEVGAPIEKAFVGSSLSKRRAVAVNHKTDQKYILFVPAEGGEGNPSFTIPGFSTGDGGTPTTPSQSVDYLYSNSSSRCFVFDTFKKSWREWSGLDLSGGACVHEGTLYWQTRTYSADHGSVKYRIHRELSSGSKTDKNDHHLPILWKYATAWIHLGQPKIAKQFLRIALSSVHEYDNNDFTIAMTQQVNFLKSNKASVTISCANSSLGTAAHSRLADGKFLSSRFIFENQNESEDVEVDGWELEIASPFKPGLRT